MENKRDNEHKDKKKMGAIEITIKTEIRVNRNTLQ